MPTPPQQPHPLCVRLHVWGVPTSRILAAAARMALDRRHLHAAPGLRFAKLLGTGSGRAFTPGDADPRHWALLTVWDNAGAADAYEHGSPTHAAWARLGTETLRLDLRPVASRGTWSRREPFGRPEPVRSEGPVAALTRARIRTASSLTFWRAVPPVSADLHRSPGLQLALGIGEAPIGLQGTFSLWDSAADLTRFAYRGAAHTRVVDQTAATGWYAEELFARFAVLEASGTYAGRTPGPLG